MSDVAINQLHNKYYSQNVPLSDNISPFKFLKTDKLY